MNPGLGTYLNLLWTFGLMSLLAVGGANATIPEMHRVAVEVNHWLTDAQFADMFAIAQFSPGPNVLIVTLIGYQVAGLTGAAVTTPDWRARVLRSSSAKWCCCSKDAKYWLRWRRSCCPPHGSRSPPCCRDSEATSTPPSAW